MHVLVVDDEPSVTSIVGAWLTEAGHRVTTATNFKTAQQEMKGAAIDAVIVDVRLGESCARAGAAAAIKTPAIRAIPHRFIVVVIVSHSKRKKRQSDRASSR